MTGRQHCFLSSTDIGSGPREDHDGALPSTMTHFPALLNRLFESHHVHLDLKKTHLPAATHLFSQQRSCQHRLNGTAHQWHPVAIVS